MTKYHLPWKARSGPYARCRYLMQQGYTREDAIAIVQQELADGSLEKRKCGTPVCVRLHRLVKAREAA